MDTAKSAAGDAKGTADKVGGGSPVDTTLDTAKSVAGDAKGTAKEATGSNPVDSAVDKAKSTTQEVKSETQGGTSGGGGSPLGAALGNNKSPDGNPANAAPNFFNNFLGIENKKGAVKLQTRRTYSTSFKSLKKGLSMQIAQECRRSLFITNFEPAALTS